MRTPLFAAQAGARMVDFHGWEMPVQYHGVIAEHQAVRQTVGVFDISHMGKLRLTADVATLERLVPSRLRDLQPGQSRYTVLLNEAGGILDDVIIYALADREWFVIVNGATQAADIAWLESQGLTLTNLSAAQILLAVQGPQATAMLQRYLDLPELPRFGHTTLTYQGQPLFIARTGYTGEDGYEVMLPIATGLDFWPTLLAAGVTPCGLGARDTLRLEAALHLYGQDMDAETTPLEAGLAWLIDWEHDFIGKAALMTQKANGISKKLVCLQLADRAIARSGYAIATTDGQPLGQITSGTFSPSLQYPIAMGYVATAAASVGNTVQVEIRKQWQPATIVRRPFYRAA